MTVPGAVSHFYGQTSTNFINEVVIPCFFTVLLHYAHFRHTAVIWNVPLLLCKLSFAQPVGISSPTWRRLHRNKCLSRKISAILATAVLLSALRSINQAFTLPCATESHSPAVCSLSVTALTFGRCHATEANQGQMQTAEPNHKQHLNILLFLLLLLHSIHFYP